MGGCSSKRPLGQRLEEWSSCQGASDRVDFWLPTLGSKGLLLQAPSLVRCQRWTASQRPSNCLLSLPISHLPSAGMFLSLSFSFPAGQVSKVTWSAQRVWSALTYAGHCPCDRRVNFLWPQKGPGHSLLRQRLILGDATRSAFLPLCPSAAASLMGLNQFNCFGSFCVPNIFPCP